MSNKVSHQKVVFLSNAEKNEVYRIPALVYDRERKVLLAFAEKRKTFNDASSEALVMKTGSFIGSQQSAVQWSEASTVVEKQQLGGYRPMNPCPVYDRNSRSLFLFFIRVEGTVSEAWQRFTGVNKARLCYVVSTDGGQTWSQVTDLTERLPEIKTWATLGLGPGHGLQTRTGRLIVPAYAYASCSASCFCISCFCSVPRAMGLYSDDAGSTWSFGQMLDEKSLECQMAEVRAGDTWAIYCNARTEGGYRAEALSHSQAEDFSTLPAAEKLVETGRGCQGSVLSFPAQPESFGSEPEWLLYSHPTSSSKRVDLGLYLSRVPRDPNAWSRPWIINQGPSAYSDLAYMDAGRFACLMERGETSEIEQIACEVFSYDQLEQNIEK